MGASRMGFDLLTIQGWKNLRFASKYKGYKIHTYIWIDTFNQIWCWIVGHDSYDCGNNELACKRCHKYLRK